MSELVQKIHVENRLRLLCEAGILFNNSGVYELTPGNRVDIQNLISKFKADPENRPLNILQNFLELSPLRPDEGYLDAKDYNSVYREDKRLKVVFATPSMLTEQKIVEGTSLSFFAALDFDRQSSVGNSNGYEGTAVYVFCENEIEIDAARVAAAHNDQARVVIAIPRSPINVYETVFTLKAIQSTSFINESQGFSPVDNAEFQRIRRDAKTDLDNAKDAYFTNEKVRWFGKSGVEIPVHEANRYEAANRMMQEVYGSKRNTFGHNEFNKRHINLSNQIRAIFKEAGDILCDLTQPIRINWSWPENRGGNKYLRKCFVDHQVLKEINNEGDVHFFETDKEVNHFREALPAYVFLLESLQGLSGKGPVNLNQFLKPMFDEYGQGELAVTLLLLLARRYFGDSLRFKRETGLLNDIQFGSSEEMLALVLDNSPSAVILFEPVSEEYQTYFAKVVQHFSDQPAQAGYKYTISDAFQAVLKWWDGLPMIARSLSFYEEDNKPLAEAFSQLRTKDPFHFIKNDLLELLGQATGEGISKKNISKIEAKLDAFKIIAEGIKAEVEDQVLEKVAQVFDLSSHLDVDIQVAFRDWYNGLSAYQKETVGYTFHNNDSKPLVKLTSYANIRELLFKSLPEAYAIESLESWSTNEADRFAQRIKNGKTHIENNAPKDELNVTFPGNKPSNGKVIYKGELKMHADTKNGKGVIYVTVDGSDPITSQNRSELKPGDTLTISGNRKIKLVVADAQGSYSAVQTYDAIDELNKFKITRSSQRPAFDESINFIFPNSRDAAKVTLLSLLAELAKSDFYSGDSLRQDVNQTMKDIKK